GGIAIKKRLEFIAGGLERRKQSLGKAVMPAVKMQLVAFNTLADPTEGHHVLEADADRFLFQQAALQGLAEMAALAADMLARFADDLHPGQNEIAGIVPPFIQRADAAAMGMADDDDMFDSDMLDREFQGSAG